MRIRRKPWATRELMQCEFFLRGHTASPGSWSKIFGHTRPIWLELGCGRGWFVAELAAKNPDISFVGIDIKDEVLVYAKRSAEERQESPVQNLRLVSHNVEQLTEIFGGSDGIERIYINFCNPCFKNRAKKHRLTHTRQLEQYKKLLCSGGEIHFKTDNDELYMDTKRYFAEAGFTVYLDEPSYQPLSDPGSPTTEHEKMFHSQGIPIKRLLARLS